MITVDSIIQDYGFEISFLAGEAGGNRPLLWAHVVDLEDPWNWIGPGELILTTGGGIPAPGRQEQWVRQVIASGAIGLIVAPRPGTHNLTEAALSMADNEGFPVLSAAFGTKFTVLAKEIINSSIQRESRRLAAAQRTFNVFSASLMRTETVETRLRGIARSVGIDFEIIDHQGQRICGSSEAMGGTVLETTLDSWTAPLSAIIRTSGHKDLELGSTLQHTFASVAAIELQRRVSEVLLRNRASGIMLRSVCTGSLPLETLTSFLETETGVDSEQFSIVALAPGITETQALAVAVSPQLWNRVTAGAMISGRFVLLTQTAPADLLALRLALGDLSGGISRPISEGNTPAEALGQALLAGECTHTPGALQEVPDLLDEELYLPSDRERCRIIASSILSPLWRYDTENGTDLLKTLQVYYESDRSPSRSSEALFIHRHTLIYRLKSIQRILDLDPSATRSIVTLWIAIEASRRSGWPH